MILMRENPLLGPLERVGLKISSFLGQNGISPLSMAPEMNFSASKSIFTATGTLKVNIYQYIVQLVPDFQEVILTGHRKVPYLLL
jgi:hypothetical protein